MTDKIKALYFTYFASDVRKVLNGDIWEYEETTATKNEVYQALMDGNIDFILLGWGSDFDTHIRVKIIGGSYYKMGKSK